MVCEFPESSEAMESGQWAPNPQPVTNDDDSPPPADRTGYRPLGSAPPSAADESSSDEEEELATAAADVPPIEPMERVLSRAAWTTPRPADPIAMDGDKVQQVLSAMSNFSLPAASIPEWAQSISEEQWTQTLQERIRTMRNN